MPYVMPTFTFTHAARVAAAAKQEGETELTRAAQAGVIELMGDKTPELHDEEEDDGPSDPLEIIFHCFDYHGRFNMIMAPGGDGTLLVDVAEVEESAPLEEGPFKGRKVILPRMFSDDEGS